MMPDPFGSGTSRTNLFDTPPQRRFEPTFLSFGLSHEGSHFLFARTANTQISSRRLNIVVHWKVKHEEQVPTRSTR